MLPTLLLSSTEANAGAYIGVVGNLTYYFPTFSNTYLPFFKPKKPFRPDSLEGGSDSPTHALHVMLSVKEALLHAQSWTKTQ